VTRSLAPVAAWLLVQVAALPDTIVTIPGPQQTGWFERTTGALDAIMTLAFIILTVAVVPAAWNFRKSYKKINDVVDKVYADINPITHHLSRIADNLDYITTAIRADVQKASLTVNQVNERLAATMEEAEGRVRDFNALIAVVQEEAESTFVSAAATVRGMREGAATFRDDTIAELSGERGPESDEELDDELDALDELDDLYGMRAVRDTDEEDADGDDIGRGLGDPERPRVRPRYDA
jgi:uncharacterized protein YoxC